MPPAQTGAGRPLSNPSTQDSRRQPRGGPSGGPLQTRARSNSESNYPPLPRYADRRPRVLGDSLSSFRLAGGPENQGPAKIIGPSSGMKNTPHGQQIWGDTHWILRQQACLVFAHRPRMPLWQWTRRLREILPLNTHTVMYRPPSACHRTPPLFPGASARRCCCVLYA